MKFDRKPDFEGYASKNDLLCTDGRTIIAHAFKDQDGDRVPLVWQHLHDSPGNVIGHAVLENRADGVYCYGFFNNNARGVESKELVRHGDVNSLSIYANRLVQKGRQVLHGAIREISLVLAGANPGAKITNVSLSHSDGSTESIEDEALIQTGFVIQHSDSTDDRVVHSDTDDDADDQDLSHEDVSEDQKILDSMNDEQKTLLHSLVGAALASGNVAHEDSDDEDDLDHSDEDQNGSDTDSSIAHDSLNTQEEDTMAHNVFEKKDDLRQGPILTHSDVETILSRARELGSLKAAFLAHDGLDETVLQHGITDIELLFPDAKASSAEPNLLSRRMDWVDVVLKETKHIPFSKIKTLVADITAQEARARGYIKGNEKLEEVFPLLKRSTGPTTIYKKQSLDRDDVVDITDIDVVLFLKREMRLMIEEELARAILVGDGRSAMSPDKVKDPGSALSGDGIRSIVADADLYSHKVTLPANTSPKDVVKGIIRSRIHYRGSGKPTLFISEVELTDIMLEEDKIGRPLYETEQVLADKLRVAKIVPVGILDETPDVMAILVNLNDYSVGATKGGEITNFEDFDIDFNKHKYLGETRVSGALTLPKGAVVIKRNSGTEAVPAAPTFNPATNTITIPTTTGVIYTIDDDVVTGSVVITEDTSVDAHAEEDYYIKPGSVTNWGFTFQP